MMPGSRSVSLPQLNLRGRGTRTPQHTFRTKHKAWQIAPFMIAPVLPGETLRNLLLQARAVSDPVAHSLIGWHLEYYFFYVKHRDLDHMNNNNTLQNMMIDPSTDTSAYDITADDVAMYEEYDLADVVDGKKWMTECHKKITVDWFRDEGEAASAASISGVYAAQILRTNWLDSVMSDTEYVAEDVNVDINSDTNIMASEIDEAMRQWQLLRVHGLTEMSYEDYLGTYGIQKPEELGFRSELIRYIREWKYPVNTIDPSSGAPSSALSWVIRDRADKNRLFREPGWIIGIHVARPKVYMSKQASNAASQMRNAYHWLPALMTNDPRVSMIEHAAGEGPLQNQTDGYWVDIRDLLMYGDQFVNFALTELDEGLIDLPTADLGKKYPSAADVDLLMEASASDWVHQDGIVSLNIATHQKDQSRTTADSG